MNLLIALFTSVLFLNATAIAQIGGVSSAPVSIAPAVAGNTAENARRAQPVAQFVGGAVTVGDLEDAVAESNAFLRQRYRDPEHLKMLLAQEERFALLAQEAERRGFGQRAAVEHAVKERAVGKLTGRDGEVQKVSHKEVATYYRLHRSEFVQPVRRRAIQVKVANAQQAADVLARSVGMTAKQFRRLARDESIDEASKLKGGDIGYFDDRGRVRGEDRTVPISLARAVFALGDVGDIAPRPISVDGGYSIVMLTGIQPATTMPPKASHLEIGERLIRERRIHEIDELLKDLRERHPVELHPELLGAVDLEN